MLEIKDLYKTFGIVPALHGVSLRLEFSKTHVILGSSGSGKSTLLRAILGLVQFTSGDILINGASVGTLSQSDRAKMFGYVPQDAGLFPHLTAFDNISLVARTLCWSADRIQTRIRELQNVVELSPQFLSHYPNELSGGQKQRVAIMRALALDPPILLMDEPFSSLDPLIRAEIQSEAKALFTRLKKTVVFITHDVGEADYLADSIILLHDGRIVQQGKLVDLIERPADPFVTRFLNAQRVFQLAREFK